MSGSGAGVVQVEEAEGTCSSTLLTKPKLLKATSQVYTALVED